MLRKKTLFHASILVALGIATSSCATPVPVNNPCGVITDSLKDVHATTKIGEQRITLHYQAGLGARCWK